MNIMFKQAAPYSDENQFSFCSVPYLITHGDDGNEGHSHQQLILLMFSPMIFSISIIQYNKMMYKVI